MSSRFSFPFSVRFPGGTLRFDNSLMPHDQEHQCNWLHVSFPLARRRSTHALFERTGIPGCPMCSPAPSRTVASRGTTNSARSAKLCNRGSDCRQGPFAAITLLPHGQDLSVFLVWAELKRAGDNPRGAHAGDAPFFVASVVHSSVQRGVEAAHASAGSDQEKQIQSFRRWAFHFPQPRRARFRQYAIQFTAPSLPIRAQRDARVTPRNLGFDGPLSN